MSEATPSISDTDPERSSMGQGTHQFASVQLARYVTALANRGTVYDLSLIDKETDSWVIWSRIIRRLWRQP
ncbi:MAG: hypothetical protein ACLR3S_01300 [Clostridium fessum]